jgi:hypothetical protein
LTYAVLLALHIAVLGYWLGSELVINSEYRFIVRRADLPVSARDAMTDHLMQADQHVRYALVLQAMLGTMLLAQLDLAPGWTGMLALPAGLAWLALVEITHRARGTARGHMLARFDRGLRYGVAALLLASAFGVTDWPGWLRLKLGLFAGIIGCGVLIRFKLIRHFAVWSEVVAQGSSPERETALRSIYRRATGILLMLWALIAAITLLAIFKPA